MIYFIVYKLYLHKRIKPKIKINLIKLNRQQIKPNLNQNNFGWLNKVF